MGWQGGGPGAGVVQQDGGPGAERMVWSEVGRQKQKEVKTQNSSPKCFSSSKAAESTHKGGQIHNVGQINVKKMVARLKSEEGSTLIHPLDGSEITRKAAKTHAQII